MPENAGKTLVFIVKHNFSKPRFKIVPDRIPKFAVGTRVVIISTQHPLDGKSGKITQIFPAQNNCFYKIRVNGKETPTLPERMLELLK